MDVRSRPDARNDAELVRAATAGDRGAFAALYDRYADRLHDFCWSVLRDRDEAADATQDTFLVAAEHLSQLRDQVERSLGALLVARLGRADCPELAQVLSGWDGRFSPLIRKRVARHVDTCEVCGTASRRLASPLALLAAVPPMPAPADLRGRVLAQVQLTGAAKGPEGDGGGMRSFLVERVAKEALPVERIWNRTGQPVLRLITCGGEL